MSMPLAPENFTLRLERSVSHEEYSCPYGSREDVVHELTQCLPKNVRADPNSSESHITGQLELLIYCTFRQHRFAVIAKKRHLQYPPSPKVTFQIKQTQKHYLIKQPLNTLSQLHSRGCISHCEQRKCPGILFSSELY